MTLPTAIAAGRGAETPDAIEPLRVGIAAGVLAALYLFALYLVHPVPDRFIALLGGPSDAFGREGGLRMEWQPPAGADPRSIEQSFAMRGSGTRIRHTGDAFTIEVPGVAEPDVPTVARRITVGSGLLQFQEVLQVPEMKDLAGVLGLPMNGQRPLDIEIDQWRLDDGGSTHTDYYLSADTRERIEQALADAASRGWKLPAGAHIAYEYLEPTNTLPEGWRTYVLSDRVELDGTAIADAIPSYDPNNNRPLVLLDFTRDAADTFGEVTSRIVGKKLAIVVEGAVKSAPIINGPIHGGRASITMGSSDPAQQEHERDQLVGTLRGAGLPSGGTLRSAEFVPSGETPARLWTARVAIALGAGLLVGLIAWALVRALRPTRRHLLRGEGRLPWRRLAVVLLAPATALALSYVPIFGLDYVELEAIAPSPKQTFNAGIFGVIPLASAYVVIELLALVIPGWRRRRHAGPEARRPLDHAVAALAFVLVVFQSWGIMQYVESFSRTFGMVELDKAARAMVVTTFAGATLVYAAVAHVIRRHGLGNGFGALTLGGWLVFIAWPWLTSQPLLDAQHVMGGAALVALAVPLAVALRWQVRGAGEPALRVPTSGIAPIGDAGGLYALFVVVASLPFVNVTDKVGQLVTFVRDNMTLTIAIVGLVTVAWSYAFARPQGLKALAARAGVGEPSGSTFWRATLLSVAVLLFSLAPTLVPSVVPSMFDNLTEPLTAAVCVAVVLDILDDMRARRGTLVVAWSMHHVQRAELVAQDLAQAGIPCHLASSNLRTLLAFFGPFAPIDVLVPPAQLPAARERIATLAA